MGRKVVAARKFGPLSDRERPSKRRPERGDGTVARTSYSSRPYAMNATSAIHTNRYVTESAAAGSQLRTEVSWLRLLAKSLRGAVRYGLRPRNAAKRSIGRASGGGWTSGPKPGCRASGLRLRFIPSSTWSTSTSSAGIC